MEKTEGSADLQLWKLVQIKDRVEASLLKVLNPDPSYGTLEAAT